MLLGVKSAVARRRALSLFCATAGVIGPLAHGLFADTAATWDGTNNNWSSAADWSTNPFYPNNGTPVGTLYAVTINSGTVSLNVNPTIDSLILGSSGTLEMDTGDFLKTGTLNNSGQFSFVGGGDSTVTGAATNSGGMIVNAFSTTTFLGNLTNGGSFVTSYFTSNDNNLVNIAGTLSNTGTFTVGAAGDVANVSALSNSGTLNVNVGTTLNITGGGTGVTDIVAGSEYDLAGNFNVINGGTPTGAIAHLASVEGTLYLEGGQTVTVSSAVVNTGSILVNNGTTASFSGNLTNSNDVITSYFANADNLINVGGTLTNSSGASFQLRGAGDIADVHALSNTGDVSIGSGAALNITGGGSGVTDVVAGSEYDLAGNFNVISGGTPTGALAHLASVEGTLYLEGGQTFTFSSAVTNSGDIFVNNGTTASFSGNLTNSNDVITSYFANADNLINVGGTLTNSSGASLQLRGAGDVADVHALSNSGDVSVGTGATLNITGGGTGVTDVVAGSEYDLAGNFNVINGGTPTGAIAHLASVEGTLYLEGGQTVTVSSAVVNTGSILVNNGTTASFSGNLTNSNDVITSYFANADNLINVGGTLTNSSGASFQLRGAGDIADVHALSNTGDVSIGSGAALNITGGGSGVTDVVAGSEYDLAGNFNVISGGTPTGALAHLASVEGTLYLEGGQTFTFSSAVTNSGDIFVNNGTTASFSGNLTNSNDVITSYFANADNLINVGGTLTNSSGASLQLRGAGDVADVHALSNTGDVSVGTGATLNITGGGTGVTDVVAGSEYDLAGNFNVINGGTPTSAIAHLASVEGTLYLESGQAYTLGSLTTNSGDIFVNNGTTAAILGSLTNSNEFFTGYFAPGNNRVSVSGTFTNTAAGNLELNQTGDFVSVNTLTNLGAVGVGGSALLDIGPGAVAASGGGPTGVGGVYVVGSGTSMGVLTNTSGSVSIFGPMTVGSSGRVNINGGSVSAGGLTISGNGVVNVNGILKINYGAGPDPISAIVADLKASYQGGAWGGTAGIISTSAQAAVGTKPLLSVGYGDGNIDTGLGNTSLTAAGPNQVLVMFTLAGDALLNGTVNFNDLDVVGKHLNTSGNDWAQGNFNYDPNGATNFNDLDIVGQNLNKNLGSMEGVPGNIVSLSATESSGNTIVTPEPTALALAAAGASVLLARRRRRRV